MAYEKREIVTYAKDNSYTDKLQKRIEYLPSVAAIYRDLKNFLNNPCSESTFRKRFKISSSIETWINDNIYYKNWPDILEKMGTQDSILEKMIEEAGQIWKKANKKPPLIDPPICRGF